MEPKRITIAQLKQKMDANEPLLFIDTRNPHDWGNSEIKIPGARRIHYSELEQRMDELPLDRTIITYCT